MTIKLQLIATAIAAFALQTGAQATTAPGAAGNAVTAGPTGPANTLDPSATNAADPMLNGATAGATATAPMGADTGIVTPPIGEPVDDDDDARLPWGLLGLLGLAGLLGRRRREDTVEVRDRR